ncbi:MAG TPA: hypothetical protein VFF68_10985, partial [Anaerolineaceae bacterium]|nr:hypothetical protein [Anaerolineaceae bacterium]
CPLEGDLATMNEHVFQFRKVYQLQEDEAWFGPLGWLLAFPTGLWALAAGLKHRRCLYLSAPVFLLSAFVAGTFVRPGWTPYDGRYFMPAAAISAAFLPLWFSAEKPRLNAVTAWLVVIFSLISIGMVVIVNPSKPVFGDHAVWGKHRIDLLTLQSYNTKDTLYMVEESIPPDAVVGIATDHRDYQEYGVFGEGFRRQVIQVYPPEKVADAQWLADRGIEYLLILVSPDYPKDIAPGFEYVNSQREWLICAARP